MASFTFSRNIKWLSVQMSTEIQRETGNVVDMQDCQISTENTAQRPCKTSPKVAQLAVSSQLTEIVDIDACAARCTRNFLVDSVSY